MARNLQKYSLKPTQTKGDITVNMDFPMTAGDITNLQSSPATDTASSSQATGSERFSSHFKDETSQRNSTGQYNQNASKTEPSRKEPSESNTSKLSEASDNKGNSVPEEGNSVPDESNSAPKEATTKAPVENEVEKIEAEIDAEIAELDPIANPLQLNVAAQKASIPAANLDTLQKMYPGASTPQVTADLQSIGVTEGPKNGSPLMVAGNGSPTALGALQTPVNEAKTPLPLATATPTVETVEVEADIDEVFQKLAETQTSTPKSAAANAGPVGITTAMSELGRPSFATSTVSSVPTVPQPALAMQQPGWNQAMGNSVQWMLKENIQEANIRLKPSELGPINVKLSMNNEQLSLSLNAAHAATREMLESNIPRIREAFGASHLNLGNVDVSDQSLPQHQQQLDMEFSQFADNGQGENTLAEAIEDADLSLEDDNTFFTQAPVRETAGVLDLFA